jgi:hypothetical protein
MTGCEMLENDDQLDINHQQFGQTFTIKKNKKSHSMKKRRKQHEDNFNSSNSPIPKFLGDKDQT